MSLLVILVGLITTFFMSEFVSGLLIGSAFNTKNPTYYETLVYDDPFVANDTTAQSLSNNNITQGTMVITNSSGANIGVGNFTIDYAAGTVLLG